MFNNKTNQHIHIKSKLSPFAAFYLSFNLKYNQWDSFFAIPLTFSRIIFAYFFLFLWDFLVLVLMSFLFYKY